MRSLTLAALFACVVSATPVGAQRPDSVPEPGPDTTGLFDRLLAGGGFDPLGPDIDLGAGVSAEPVKVRLSLEGRLERDERTAFLYARARLSQLDVLQYYGLGNATVAAGDRADHRVDHTIAGVEVGVGLARGQRVEWTVGARVDRSTTDRPGDRNFATYGPLYGDGAFVQAALTTRLELDPLRRADHTPHRLRLRLTGIVYPGLFDTESSTGSISVEGAALLATSHDPLVSLLLRGRLHHVRGTFPWFRAAFLGGSDRLRGWYRQRFAGDAALSSGAELRVRVVRSSIVTPMSAGVFVFTDVGRVWLDGRTPGGWKRGVGGGVWARPTGHRYFVQGGLGFGEEATKLVVEIGVFY